MKIYKKILELAVWVLIALYLVVILGFVAEKENMIRCRNIDIRIVDKTNNRFVEKSDIVSMFNAFDIEVLGNSIDSLQLEKMEKLILSEQHSIKSAEVFFTADGTLHIDLIQRKPILRIINYDNTGYYIDDEGALMRLSHKYSSHILIANGNINQPYDLRYTTNVSELNDENIPGNGKLLFDLYTLAEYINNDDFWKAQIQQIYVTNNNEFELIPKVGDHIIQFGKIDNYKKKFRNLMLMYTKSFKAEGWNKYKIINLKYDNQVVCTKK